MYYSKGNIEETVTNESKIELEEKWCKGIYSRWNNLVNNSDITSSTNALNSIASYIETQLLFQRELFHKWKNGIGIYVESGTGINSTLGK